MQPPRHQRCGGDTDEDRHGARQREIGQHHERAKREAGGEQTVDEDRVTVGRLLPSGLGLLGAIPAIAPTGRFYELQHPWILSASIIYESLTLPGGQAGQGKRGADGRPERVAR